LVTDQAPTGTVFVKTVRPAAHAAAEAEALRAFGSDRAARVIDVCSERGELALELIEPGSTLAAIADEDAALHVVADLFASEWPRPPLTTALAPFDEFACALLNGGAECARACRVLSELLDDGAEPAILHGDLHYGNILSSRRAGYLLIDPKGVIGDPAFDIGYLVSRPAPSAADALSVARAIERRLSFLPDALGLDPRRVAAYAYVAAAMSMAWSIEDNDVSATHAFADVMRMLKHRS
jgi:streptomycin 6-kinase